MILGFKTYLEVTRQATKAERACRPLEWTGSQVPIDQYGFLGQKTCLVGEKGDT